MVRLGEEEREALRHAAMSWSFVVVGAWLASEMVDMGLGLGGALPYMLFGVYPLSFVLLTRKFRPWWRAITGAGALTALFSITATMIELVVMSPLSSMNIVMGAAYVAVLLIFDKFMEVLRNGEL